MKIRKMFQCNIKEDVIDKFNLAIQLNKENVDEVIEKYMMQYISCSFSKASKTYRTPIQSKNTSETDDINSDKGKASFRIPRWAKSQNSIIIKL